MFAGLKTLVAAVVIGTFAGAVFGVLVGILADYQTTIELFGIELPGILQWIVIVAVGFGCWSPLRIRIPAG